MPAHSLSTTPIDVDPDYHRVSHEIEPPDMQHLTNVIRAIARGADPIVSGAAVQTANATATASAGAQREKPDPENVIRSPSR